MEAEALRLDSISRGATHFYSFSPIFLGGGREEKCTLLAVPSDNAASGWIP